MDGSADKKTIRSGVLGWPVSHSLSPRLHGYWLKKYGINGSYEPLAVKPEDFAQAMRMLSHNGFAGANVTVPYKEEAVKYVDEIEKSALRIGAVNTIIVQADGRLSGRNTDGFGFLENLKLNAPLWRPTQGPAVVIGAGGAARAVCAALIDSGIPELRLVNRTGSRAETMAGHIGGPIRVFPWEEREKALDAAALLVNATTMGMTGNPPLELDLSRLPVTAVVNDIVYAPLVTALLASAGGRGNPAVDGLGMLLHQARPGFAAWFGVEPKVTAGLRAHVLRGLG